MLGAPGSGKGTLTSRLLKKVTQLSSISTGDLLRQEIGRKSSMGKVAEEYIKQGALLPDDFMAKFVTAELGTRNWLNNRASFLLDGFPRTGNQAVQLDNELLKHDSRINLVVELNVPPEVILERIDNRWVHASSGRVYNLSYNPPKVPFKDDITGEPLTKRSDDNPEIFKVRLDKYFEQLKSIKEFYQQQGVFSTVSGDTSDIIFPKLLQLVESKFT
ncbi:Adenylate kinase 2 [Brettanomyces nanus]|uniref:GTP:AMP phosphotransferase, mitochondrial n=1 Tax=Eeniella nana TaxID=13502 RepID=A0A875SF54_EENNA|nr:Adenylate kinase 2 [Brettanomyces nanus]QPG77244.1 Adenylate kinase 2 [Brettanomyces nanus]